MRALQEGSVSQSSMFFPFSDPLKYSLRPQSASTVLDIQRCPKNYGHDADDAW